MAGRAGGDGGVVVATAGGLQLGLSRRQAPAHVTGSGLFAEAGGRGLALYWDLDARVGPPSASEEPRRCVKEEEIGRTVQAQTLGCSRAPLRSD